MKRTFYIPTYEEAQEIVKNSGELVFYENVQYIDGYKISTFNYRLATYNDFVKYKGAYEMRGLCFVFNLDGSLFNRYILLHKFFNLNQVEETQLHLIKDIPFAEVHDKADGSVITFVRLPNGKVLAKTKMIVGENEQASAATNLYNNDIHLKSVVDYMLDNDMVAVFEFVSPKNRVVLRYDKTELILTRVRNNKTGEYFPIDTVAFNTTIKTVYKYNSDVVKCWDDLLCLVETTENIEGWVVTLQNGDLVKLKTKWYCDLHHLITDFVNREDYLIEMTLDEKIDDIKGQLSEEQVEVHQLVDNVVIRVQTFLTEAMHSIEEMKYKFQTEYNGNRKDFALANRKHPLFGLIMSSLDGKDTFTLIVEYLKKKTYHLQDARNFIETGEV